MTYLQNTLLLLIILYLYSPTCQAQTEEYWNFFPFKEYFPNNSINDINAVGDSLLFATDNGVYIKYGDNITEFVIPGVDFNNYNHALHIAGGSDGSLLILNSSSTNNCIYYKNNTFNTLTLPNSLSTYSPFISRIKYVDGLYYFPVNQGMAIIDNGSYQKINLPSPTRDHVAYQNSIFTINSSYSYQIQGNQIIDSIPITLQDRIYGTLISNNIHIGILRRDTNIIKLFYDTNLIPIPSNFQYNRDYSYLDSQSQLWTSNNSIIQRSTNGVVDYLLDLTFNHNQITEFHEYNDKIVLVNDSGWLEAPLDIHIQKEPILDINDFHIALSPNGIVYPPADSNISNKQYEGKNIISSASLCFSGIDIQTNEYIGITPTGNIYGYSNGFEYNTYSQSSAGPIRTYYNKFNNNQTWSISTSQIQVHLNQYTNPNYAMPDAIKNWPANGRTSVGEATCLAPFIDQNNNGLYEPELGDYPQIRGEQALYAISNYQDENTEHNRWGNYEIEQHTMMYAYNHIDSLKKTIFFNYKLVNRGTKTYKEFGVIHYSIAEVGNSMDNYFGSDSIRNHYYIYNSDDIDESSYGYSGFGNSPPACAIQFLSDSLKNAVYRETVSGPAYPTVNNLGSLHDLLKGSTLPPYMMDKYHYQYPGDPVTNTGSTEISEGSSPYRRSPIGFGEMRTFAPGDTIEFEIAFVFALNTGTTNVDAIVDLRKYTDFVTQWYNTQNFEKWSYGCVDAHVSVNDMASNEQNQIKLYPNPTNDLLTIDGIDEQTEVSVYNISGQLVHQETVSGLSQLNVADYAKGMYILSVQNEHLYETHRWIKQ